MRKSRIYRVCPLRVHVLGLGLNVGGTSFKTSGLLEDSSISWKSYPWKGLQDPRLSQVSHFMMWSPFIVMPSTRASPETKSMGPV